MAFLTQTRFPALWTIFQYLIGGTVDKRKLCCSVIAKDARILEVGCSTGNITSAIVKLPIRSYTGLDIDKQTIAYARRLFRNVSKASFVCSDLLDYESDDDPFDVVLFAGVMHHVEDSVAASLLDRSSRIVQEHGKVIVIDPLLPEPGDDWLLHRYIKLERGEYLRTGADLVRLLRSTRSLTYISSFENVIGATPLSWPSCARFGVYELERRDLA